MNLFPLNQPTMALSISEESLCLVEVRKSWKKTTLREVKKISLPSGVIQLSSAKPNIQNMDVFVEHLRTLTQAVKKPISLALSLPDLCARTSVFDFSTFPTKKNEQTALLNWRFQQDLKLDTTQSRLSYEVYIPSSITNPRKNDNPENVQVLGTAIRNEIIEQYERACLDLNLMPVSVSIAGLDIFDLYHRSIQTNMKTENNRSLDSSPGAMFLFMSYWGFIFLTFHDGCPTFVRTKAIAIQPSVSPKDEGPSPTEQGTGEKRLHHTPMSVKQELEVSDEDDSERVLSPYPSHTITKVEKEVLATLQYYLETYSQNKGTSFPTNLFFITDLEHGHMLLPSSEYIQQSAKLSGLTASPIQVTQFSYTTYFTNRDCGTKQESNIWSALPGYASLRVA